MRLSQALPRRGAIAWRRWVFAAALAWLGVAAAARAAPVVVLQVQDAIGPATADYIVRGIAGAARQQARLVVLELDTPGGLDTSMRQIIQAILAAPLPVAVYVVAARRARRQRRHLHPVRGAHRRDGAGDQPGRGDAGGDRPDRRRARAAPGNAASRPDAAPAADPMTAKRVNDAAAFIRGLAQLRGRNAAWAERAVREAVSLTASEALREHVVDVVAADVPDLLAQIDGRTVQLHGRCRHAAHRAARRSSSSRPTGASACWRRSRTRASR